MILMKLFTKQNRLTDIENKLMVTTGEVEEGYIGSMRLE